jgi:CysZ protein
MRNNPITGFGYALTGLRLLSRPGLRRFIILPVLINCLVFALLLWGGIRLFDDFMAWMLPADSWLIHLEWLLWPLFAIAAVILVFYSFTLVANLLAAPFNGLLAEQVEALLSGRPAPAGGGWGQLAKEFLPGLAGELRKLSYFLLRALPLLVLFLIPGLNLAAPFLWLAFGAWYLALEYAGFPMDNHGLGFAEQHARLRRIRLNALGFGAGVTLLMTVPGLNLVAMPAAVAGATALWVRELAPTADPAK